jgi:hypothetical protein
MADETQYAMCKEAIKKGEFIPITIGTRHYDTFLQLEDEFGEGIDVSIQKKLCKYFAQGTDFTGITDETDRKKVAEFLGRRIKILEDGGETKRNISFRGKWKRDFIDELNDIIKKLATPSDAAKATSAASVVAEKTGPKRSVNKEEVARQLFTALYKVANLKGKDVQVDSRWDGIMELIDSMAPDEALRNSADLRRAEKEADKKANPNSLEKYISGATEAPSKTPQSDKTNIDLIKLYTLFKTGAFINKSGAPMNLSSSISTFENQPMIIESMFLYQRTIMRFFRARYLEVIKQFNDFLRQRMDINNYPENLMIKLVFIMFNLSRYVFTDEYSRLYNIFPKKQGLLRFNLSDTSFFKTTREYQGVFKLIEDYNGYITDQQITNETGAITAVAKDSLNYQLLHLHTRTPSAPNRTKPIMQLICGKNININKETLRSRIGKITNISSDEQKDLIQSITNFFDDDSIYIIYQETPINLITQKQDETKDRKILQLSELQCIMGIITDKLGAEDDDTKPVSIDSKKIIPKLEKNNTFSDFGIRLRKEPFNLVNSITQMTGTLLNAVYLDNKLKAIRKSEQTKRIFV